MDFRKKSCNCRVSYCFKAQIIYVRNLAHLSSLVEEPSLVVEEWNTFIVASITLLRLTDIWQYWRTFNNYHCNYIQPFLNLSFYGICYLYSSNQGSVCPGIGQVSGYSMEVHWTPTTCRFHCFCSIFKSCWAELAAGRSDNFNSESVGQTWGFMGKGQLIVITTTKI